jgi:hypothetical protein
LHLAVPVTRQVQISGPSEWKHLVCGIDTLDLGFYVDWRSAWVGLEKALRAGKQSAEKSMGVTFVHRNVEKCLIFAGGKAPMYAFHLQTAEVHLFIARCDKAEDYPNVYVSVLAKSLWLRGIAASVEQISILIGRLGGHVDRVQISRVDLAADFVIPGGLTLEFLMALRVAHSSSVRHVGARHKLEAFYVGGNGAPIIARIYDKSEEIAQKGLKDWFFALVWKIEKRPDVWRVEFQMRRQAMKELNIESLEDLAKCLKGIWNYLTEEWLSFRLLDAVNTSRRTVHPWWQAVSDAGEQFGGSVAVTRDYSKGGTASAEWYVSHAAGCLVGFGARTEIDDIDSALGVLAEAIRSYWATRDFEERLRIARIKLGFDDTADGGAHDAG